MSGQAVAGHRMREMPRPSQAEAEHGNALEDAIHHLAQPLTALLFVVEMGRMQQNPQLWKAALDSAGDESRRAVAALEVLRSAAENMAAVCKEGA